MEIIENYKSALQAVYDHVGFKEDFVVCPLDDCMEMFWELDGDEIRYADSKEELESREGNCYSDEIYKQRFYDKWVYEGQLFTMVFCNPGVDGMKWFRLFDNTKRVLP